MPVAAFRVGGVERGVLKCARLERRSGDGAGDLRVVGGDHLAAAVEHRHRRALRQLAGPQHVIDPVHVQRDGDRAVETAIGPVQRQHRPDHRAVDDLGLQFARHGHGGAVAGLLEHFIVGYIDPLGQSQGGTRHPAMGVDARQVGEIAHPDQGIGQHPFAIAIDVLDVGKAAHGAQYLFRRGEQILVAAGGIAGGLDQLLMHRGDVGTGARHALKNADQDHRQQRQDDDGLQPLSQSPTRLGG